MYRPILVAVLLLCFSCTADNPPETTAENFSDPEQTDTSRVTPHAVQKPVNNSGQLSTRQVEYALEALADNLVRTDLTALLEILAVTRGDSNAGNADEGLVPVKYVAKVVQRYAGDAADTIEYLQYIGTEKLPGVEIGEIRIVSLCKDNTGQYYLPDMGYELPATEAIKAQASLIAKRHKTEQRLQGDTGVQSDCR